jgi:hypothetical protein
MDLWFVLPIVVPIQDDVDLLGLIDTEADQIGIPTHASSLFPLSENHVPIVLVRFGYRLLTFATAIGRGYCGGCLAPLSLG